MLVLILVVTSSLHLDRLLGMQGQAAMTPRVNSVLGDAKRGKHDLGIKVTIEGRHTTIHKTGVGNAY